MNRHIRIVTSTLFVLVLAVPATATSKEIVLRELTFVGNVLRRVPAASYAACSLVCSRTAQCASFTFRSRSCSLHRARARLVRAPGALSGYRPAAPCARDADCSDGKFCNGAEQCRPGTRGANSRGCIAGIAPCSRGQVCNEQSRHCGTSCANPDRDGDGHRSIACGGDDCDDNDAARYPGNPEICDAAGHDEDCDPCTVGARDSDGDGHVDANCWNANPNQNSCLGRKVAYDLRRLRVTGTDCDDSNPVVVPGAQVCGESPTQVKVCGGAATGVRSSAPWSGPWELHTCPGTTAKPGYCVAQPNGTGVCVR